MVVMSKPGVMFENNKMLIISLWINIATIVKFATITNERKFKIFIHNGTIYHVIYGPDYVIYWPAKKLQILLRFFNICYTIIGFKYLFVMVSLNV